jgi:hypothetical protein
MGGSTYLHTYLSYTRAICLAWNIETNGRHWQKIRLYVWQCSAETFLNYSFRRTNSVFVSRCRLSRLSDFKFRSKISVRRSLVVIGNSSSQLACLQVFGVCVRITANPAGAVVVPVICSSILFWLADRAAIRGSRRWQDNPTCVQVRVLKAVKKPNKFTGTEDFYGHQINLWFEVGGCTSGISLFQSFFVWAIERVIACVS